MAAIMATQAKKKKVATTTTDAAEVEMADETHGQRLGRLRRARGLTQVELAQRVGTIQALVSDYERDRLRLNAEVTVQLARALSVSTDVLLGVVEVPAASGLVQRAGRLNRRLRKMEQLPPADQRAVLRFIDALAASRELAQEVEAKQMKVGNGRRAKKSGGGAVATAGRKEKAKRPAQRRA